MGKNRARPVGGYVWGAAVGVLNRAQRRGRIKADLRDSLGGGGAEPGDAGDARVADWLYTYHARLTDKAAALLQTVSLVAAISGAFVALDMQDEVIPVLGVMALAGFLMLAFVLSLGLKVYWPKLPANLETAAEKRATIETSLICELQKRTWRHTLSVYILMVLFLVVAADFCVRVWPAPRPAWMAALRIDASAPPASPSAGTNAPPGADRALRPVPR